MVRENGNKIESRQTFCIDGIIARKNYNGLDAACSSCLVRANPKNIGTVWIELYTQAIVDYCWPLEPGDVVPVDVKNTKYINALFESAGDKAILLFDNP